MLEKTIELTSPFGSQVPPRIIADALRTIVPAAESSVIMAIEGRGKLVGRKPRWAQTLADIRFRGAEPSKSKMLLKFEAPRLVEAAPELFRQGDFWRTRLSENYTAIDVLAASIADVSQERSDSDTFDVHVLSGLKKFARVVREDATLNLLADQEVLVDEPFIAHVDHLTSAIPAPSELRIVGRLDMLRASTHAFALKLKDGTQVAGVYLGEEMMNIRPFLNEKVLIQGTLVFRPNGRPLRVDARTIRLAKEEPAIWERLPLPLTGRVRETKLRRSQGQHSGLNALIGQWPGDESDSEIAEALAEIS